MTPKDFPEKNMTFVAEGCLDLPAYKGDGVIVTAWELTEEELDILTRTRTVYLMVVGQGTPPVSLMAEYPFKDKSEYPDLIEEKP